MCFHFPVMPMLYYSLREEKAAPIVDVLADTPDDPARHPVGHLPAQPRRAHPRDGHAGAARRDVRLVRARPPDARERRHPAAAVAAARQQPAEIELIHALLLSLPGSPCLYYGDEIGMGDNIWLNDRDAVRTPMQWTPDRNSGLLLRRPRQALPAGRVVASSTTTTTSTSRPRWPAAPRCCTGCAAMLQIRKRHPVFGLGDFEVCPSDNEAVLSFLRVDLGPRRTAPTPRRCSASTTSRAGRRPRRSACPTSSRAPTSRTSLADKAFRRSPTTAPSP